jgi:hypothetical protein
MKKGKDLNVIWVFRRRDEGKFYTDNIRVYLIGGGASLMIWAYFTNNIKDPLISIYGRVIADIYIQLLEIHLVSYMDDLHQYNIHNTTFQQDNISIYKVYKVRDYFTQ